MYYSYYRITFTLRVMNSKEKTLSFARKENKMKSEMWNGGVWRKMVQIQEATRFLFPLISDTFNFLQKFANWWFCFQFSVSHSTKKPFFLERILNIYTGGEDMHLQFRCGVQLW